MAGRLRRFGRLLPIYAKLAWWGLVTPRVAEPRPLVVHQAIVRSGRRVLLTVRSDLRGWELPGGNAESGERGEEALRREVLEETGLAVEVERLVGEYVRTGFRPHAARVYLCRPVGGALRPSPETPRVAWFDVEGVPATLFPWYRAPLADAAEPRADPVRREEHQGLRSVLAGMAIDLRMRWTDDRAG